MKNRNIPTGSEPEIEIKRDNKRTKTKNEVLKFENSDLTFKRHFIKLFQNSIKRDKGNCVSEFKCSSRAFGKRLNLFYLYFQYEVNQWFLTAFLIFDSISFWVASWINFQKSSAIKFHWEKNKRDSFFESIRIKIKTGSIKPSIKLDLVASFKWNYGMTDYCNGIDKLRKNKFECNNMLLDTAFEVGNAYVNIRLWKYAVWFEFEHTTLLLLYTMHQSAIDTPIETQITREKEWVI